MLLRLDGLVWADKKETWGSPTSRSGRLVPPKYTRGTVDASNGARAGRAVLRQAYQGAVEAAMSARFGLLVRRLLRHADHTSDRGTPGADLRLSIAPWYGTRNSDATGGGRARRDGTGAARRTPPGRIQCGRPAQDVGAGTGPGRSWI